MELLPIHTYQVFWQKNGRYGVKIQFQNNPQKTCFISEKQYRKLERCLPNESYSTAGNFVYGVFDDDRFVWCGNQDEVTFLEKHFGVDAKYAAKPDPHLENLKNPVPVIHDDLKN